MRLSELSNNDAQLDELSLGGIGSAIGNVAGGIAKGVGAVAGGIAGIGSAVKQGYQSGKNTVSGQPPGGLDPAQAALAANQQQEQKKQIQDQIKQTEQQLTDLRKQLADLG
jgi:hypothetical protein